MSRNFGITGHHGPYVPCRSSYLLELAAERKRKWKRRLLITANVVLWATLFALWIMQAGK